MIATLTEKRSDGQSNIAQLVKYIGQKNDNEHRVLFSGTRNLVSDKTDLQAIAVEMKLTAAENNRAADPFVHCILSWPEGELPDEEQCRRAVEIWAREQGLEDCQIYWVAQDDTDNRHIHIAANRIDPVTYLAAPMHFKFKSNEKAARKIEIEQGWAIQRSGHLAKVVESKRGQRVQNISTKVREKESGLDRSISKKARDSEVRTGEKSAERIAKEVAAPIIFAAQSWAEVHVQLAEKGILLELRDRGGVLIIGDKTAALSTASRKCSFANLVKRFGAFVPRDPAVEVQKFVPQLTEKAQQSEQRAAQVKEFNEIKRAYTEKKREAKAALWAEITQLRADFKAQKKERHMALREEKKKSPDFDYDAQKSLLASQLADIYKYITKKIERLKEKYKELFGGRWPSFEQWLREQERYKEAEFWRYQFSAAIILGDQTDYRLFRVFTAEVVGKIVRYRGEDSRIKLIDKGDFISVFDSTNRETVWAAITMAQQKWGAINIYGSDEFKKLAIDLIARHTEYYIRFNDSSLAQLVEDRRREFAEELERERQNQEAKRLRREKEEREAKERIELERRQRRQKMSPLELALEEVKTGGRRETPQLIAAAQKYIDLDSRPIEDIMQDETLPLIIQRLAQKTYVHGLFESMQLHVAESDSSSNSGGLTSIIQQIRDKKRSRDGEINC